MLNPEAKLNRKGFASIVVIIIALVVLAGAGAGYLAVKKQGAEAPVVPPDETADWKTYRNEKYGFEFKYPSALFIGVISDKAVNLSDYDLNEARYERGNPNGTKIQFVSSVAAQKGFPGVITSENIGGTQDEFKKVSESEDSVRYLINKPNDGNCYYLILAKKSNQQVCVFAWFKRENIDQVISTFKFTQ